MIRAHVLDENLLLLFTSVSEMSKPTAAAVFYSTANTKARLDMIRAASKTHPSVSLRTDIDALLQKVSSATARRNALVHETWTINGDEFTVSSFEPNKKTPVQEVTVTAKSIEEISATYWSIGLLLAARATEALRR